MDDGCNTNDLTRDARNNFRFPRIQRGIVELIWSSMQRGGANKVEGCVFALVLCHNVPNYFISKLRSICKGNHCFQLCKHLRGELNVTGFAVFYSVNDATASIMKSTVSSGLLSIGEWLLSTSRKVISAPESFATCTNIF